MTLKPFHPTLKLLFLRHDQDRAIKSGSLNVAQVISIQTDTEAMAQPLGLTYQNCGCVKFLKIPLCHSHQDLLHWTKK